MSGWGWSAEPPVVLWASVAAALLFALLAWAELRRARKRRRVIRLAALALVAVSLLALVLGPARRVRVAGEEAVLLTPGSEAVPEGELRAFALGSDEHGARLPDLAYLARRHPEVMALHVVGEGLPAWEWEASSARVASFSEAPPLRGFGHITWTRQLAFGEPFEVGGSVEGAAAGELRLTGAAGPADSVRLDAEAAFRLRDLPRRQGRHEYRLRFEPAAEDAGSLEAVIRLEVVEAELPRVLWVESSPAFETRHFREWFGDRGGALAVRSAISRDRFRSEYHNLERRPLRRLDETLLTDFDALVIDLDSLAALGPGERGRLAAAVAESGVGVLVRVLDGVRDEPIDLGPLGAWRRRPVGDLETHSLRPRLPGIEPAPLDDSARELEGGGELLPVIADGGGRILVGARQLGAGVVAVSLLRDTYRWVLIGESAAHQTFWSRLLETVARPDPERPRWRLRPGPILVDEPLEIELLTRQPRPVAAVATPGGEEVLAALRQDPADPERWTTRFWPVESGWHRLGGEGPLGLAFFVDEGSSWASWRRERARGATRAARLAAAPGELAVTGAGVEVSRRLSRVWFFLLLVGAAGFVWLDERL